MMMRKPRESERTLVRRFYFVSFLFLLGVFVNLPSNNNGIQRLKEWGGDKLV